MNTPGPSGPEKTRLALIQAAKELFGRRGFDSTTVKEIADLAGVNVSLVSYHYKGKEGIYRACFEHYGQDRLEATKRILGTEPTSLEEVRVRLSMFMDEFIMFQMNEPHVTRLLTREADVENPLIEDIFSELFIQIMKTLVEFILQAIKKGFLRKDADPLIIASGLFGALISFVQRNWAAEKYFKMSLKDEKFRKHLIQQMMSIYFHGLLPVEGKK